jgi:hypothetical protein
MDCVLCDVRTDFLHNIFHIRLRSSLTSHCKEFGLILDQAIWDLWLTKLHWDRFPQPPILWFSLASIIPPLLHFFSMAWQPYPGQGLLIIEVQQSHSVRHTTLSGTPLEVIESLLKPLPAYTQHSQETDIHAPGGIQTRNPSKWAATDPRLRQCGHWDQPTGPTVIVKLLL